MPNTQVEKNAKCLVTELCVVDLFDVVAENRGIKNLALLKCLYWQVIRAVQATHEAGLCHLDLKPENFLVA